MLCIENHYIFSLSTTRSIEEVSFLINFIGVNFEAGCSGLGAEQNSGMERKERFFSYRYFRESEKFRFE